MVSFVVVDGFCSICFTCGFRCRPPLNVKLCPKCGGFLVDEC